MTRTNAVHISAVGTNCRSPACAVFSYLHFLGNWVAANNFGMLNFRGIGQKRNRERAVVLFEEAVKENIVASRYNLVLTMPNRFKTRKDIVERQIALLNRKIAEGDLPSHVPTPAKIADYHTKRLIARHCLAVDGDRVSVDRNARCIPATGRDTLASVDDGNRVAGTIGDDCLRNLILDQRRRRIVRSQFAYLR